jgi:hypothetical protein
MVDPFIAPNTFVQRRINNQWTEVVMQWSDEEIRRMDRQAFRQRLRERLTAVGEALLAAFDERPWREGA